MLTAMAKQAMTIVTQIALKDLALDVEMCTRPWIVEDSKNSRSIADAISGISLVFYFIYLYHI